MHSSLDRVPILHISQLKSHLLTLVLCLSYLVGHLLHVLEASIFLDVLDVLKDGADWLHHFLVESRRQESLKEVCSLHLLIQYPKGNIFEVRDRGDFVVEQHILGHDGH